MDFTREPIIESVITPKEGCKLVVRSSKGAGQEEFFVDSLEMVSFGNTYFLRSREKPKSFLVPATDYEILEIRETRIVLKNVGLDRSIKIGGGREGAKKTTKEPVKAEAQEEPVPTEPKTTEPKRKERRRPYRRKRGKDDTSKELTETAGAVKEGHDPENAEQAADIDEATFGKPVVKEPPVLRAMLPPPPTLISETIERYKGNELFKDVFLPREKRVTEETSDETLFPQDAQEAVESVVLEETKVDTITESIEEEFVPEVSESDEDIFAPVTSEEDDEPEETKVDLEVESES